MATRSEIGIIKTSGKVDTIYAHWDGYPEYMGKALLKHYKNSRDVKSLIKDGGFSSLDMDSGEINRTNANMGLNANNMTLKDYLEEMGDEFGIEFMYLWSDIEREWLFSPTGKEDVKAYTDLKSLKDVV